MSEQGLPQRPICLRTDYTRGMDMMATHTQERCKQCGLWTIWADKKTGEVIHECRH